MSLLSYAHRRAARAAQRFRNETGQVLVLTAILVPLLLIPIGAFAVDIGHWYVVAKRAQNTADAAALAAAHELPDPGLPPDLAGPRAKGRAEQYVGLNYPGVDVNTRVTVRTPYPGPTSDASKVEVIVTVTSGTFFGRIIGISELNITRRAVAEKFEIPGNLAIFSYHQPGPCDSSQGLRFNGDNMNINGLVHSNSAFEINGKDFWAADGTIQANNCRADVDDPPTSQFGDDPAATLPRDLWPPPGHQPWPVWHTPDEFGWYDAPVGPPAPASTENCRFRAETITINDTQVITVSPNSTTNHGGTIPTGIYCAVGSTGKFEISGNNLRGTFTAVAREITVSGNGHNFTHFAHRTLFFAVPNSDSNRDNDGTPPDGAGVSCTNDKELLLNAQSYQWAGTIFSPCTRVKINGDASSTLEGTIVGYRVEVNGARFNMVGKSEVPTLIQIALVE